MLKKLSLLRTKKQRKNIAVFRSYFTLKNSLKYEYIFTYFLGENIPPNTDIINIIKGASSPPITI